MGEWGCFACIADTSRNVLQGGAVRAALAGSWRGTVQGLAWHTTPRTSWCSRDILLVPSHEMQLHAGFPQECTRDTGPVV